MSESSIRPRRAPQFQPRFLIHIVLGILLGTGLPPAVFAGDELLFADGFEADPPGTAMPPDPETVAPPRAEGYASSPCEAYSFLYLGADPVQFETDPGAIDCARLGLVTGRVIDRNGQPLGMVRVSVAGAPELGFTLTRADGEYDLAVNGGGRLILDYTRDDVLPALREVQPAMQGSTALEDVMLIELDPLVTTVSANATVPQWVTGSTVSDVDGTRTARLLVPAGTSIQMGDGNGGSQSMDEVNVRITEYTVGETGPIAMPAALPATSGYTYAVEYSVDEGIAEPVQFSQPLVSYNENFLGFDVGTVIPHGFLDRSSGQWIPAENGRVIEILGESGGQAIVAVDSGGAAADPAALAALGIDGDELSVLADVYTPGDTLWRVQVWHFSPHDYNFQLPPNAEDPPPLPPKPETFDGELSPPDFGRIDYENQVFHETLNLTGVPFALHYNSDRVPDFRADRRPSIPITRPTVSGSLAGARIEATIAGRRIDSNFGPQPDQRFELFWDGLDSYGRPVYGSQRLSYSIAYRYPANYGSTVADGIALVLPRLFGRMINLDASQGVGRVLEGRPRRFSLPIPGLRDWRPLGVAGWSPSVHHFYDAAGGVVYRGDGSRQDDGGSPLRYSLNDFAGGGSDFDTDGLPANQVAMNPEQIAVAPDGTIYYAETDAFFPTRGPIGTGGEYRIRAIDPDGTVRTVIPFGGNSCPGQTANANDIALGTASASTIFSSPVVIDVDADGRLYFGSGFCPDFPFEFDEEAFFTHAIYRLEDDGTVTRVIGADFLSVNPNDNLQADFDPEFFEIGSLEGISVLADNTLALVENGRIHRQGADGRVRHVAGIIPCIGAGCSPDGTIAVQAAMELPSDIVGLPDGSIVFSGSQFDSPIRKVTTDGILETLLPGQNERSIYQLTVGPDGVVYAATTSEDFPFVLEMIAIEADGSSRVIAGGAVDLPYAGEGGPARQQRFDTQDIAFGPDGAIYGAGVPNSNIVRIVPGDEPVPLGEQLVASRDAPEVYRFAANGRHLDTRHALTGGLLWAFDYDPDGRLVAATDGYGNRSEIQRNSAGRPTGILGPDGELTQLATDSQGFLAAATTPGNATNSFNYSSGGLLTGVTTATGQNYAMTYDGDGRLVEVIEPGSQNTILLREQFDGGFRVNVTSPEGEITRYERSVAPNRDMQQLVTRPDGSVDVTTTFPDGSSVQVLADGSSLETALAPDPRFRMQAPYAALQAIRLPGGTEQIAERSRSATLQATGTVLDLLSLSETLTVAGQQTDYLYDGPTRTETLTFPDGRSLSGIFDLQGARLSFTADGARGRFLTLDGRGRGTELRRGQGAVEAVFNYVRNATGRVSDITQPDGSSIGLSYTADGRPDVTTLEHGEQVIHSHDAAGFETAVAPPGRPPWLFTPDARQLLADMMVPPIGAEPSTFSFSYDGDRNRVGSIDPDGRSVVSSYADGRIIGVNYSAGPIDFDYDPLSGQLTAVTAPEVVLNRSHDGLWLNSETWSGALSGSVTVNPRSDRLQLAEIRVNGIDPVSYSYDSIDRATQVGPLSIVRVPASGEIASTALGVVTTTQGYDAAGRLDSVAASVSGSEVFRIELSYDAMDRVTQAVETVQGTGRTLDYGYDVRGRLISVSLDGAPVVSYGYDANGNRTRLTPDGQPDRLASYDDQDRILEFNGVQFQHRASGMLSAVIDGADTSLLDYDELGQLRSAVLPDGTSIGYLSDGLERRVQRRIDGLVDYSLLYQDGFRPAARLNASNQVEQRYVHQPGLPGAPLYLEQGGNRYRLIVDHLGSVRLVIDSATGTVIQRMDYDPWGMVTLDTNPGFQPFGFAGGLYDSDTGLVRFGRRDYYPAIGRWTARDPLLLEAGDVNFYSYVFNQPTSWIDPFGTVIMQFISVMKGVAVTVANDIGGAPPFTAGVLLATHTGSIDPIAAATSAGIFVGRKVTAPLMNKVAEVYYNPDQLVASPEDLGFPMDRMSPDDQAYARRLTDDYNRGTIPPRTVRDEATRLQEKYERGGKTLGGS